MKFDSQGFLVGERVSTSAGNASPALAVLGGVRRDVAVIRRLLESKVGRVGSQQPAARRSSGGMSTEAVAAVRATVRRAVASAASETASRGGARAAIQRVATPRARDGRGRFVRAQAPAVAVESVAKPLGSGRTGKRQAGGPAAQDGAGGGARDPVNADRDVRGRFTRGAGGSGDESTDSAGESIMGRIAGSLENIGDAVNGAENIDPTLAALKEVRDAVSPVGRGLVALHNRIAERKKDRWYSRILKAITGRKGDAVAGGGGDVTRGSFLGTFLGETIGNAARLLPAMLAGAGGLLLKGLGLLGAFGIGQYIGGKIYEWLDKSGIATKVFDAFDAVGKWFRDKIDAAGGAARRTVNATMKASRDAQLGSDEARYGRLSAEDRREARLGGRGGAGTSMAYKAGQAAGTLMRGVDVAGGAIKRILGTGAGYNVVEREDGSVVKQAGARNWRNNNPGNIEFGPFAQRMGAIGSDGRFAIFPDYETGRRAKAALIFEGKNYRDLSLSDAISRYAPPTENNTAAYQREVLASVGGENRKMADYSPAERDAILGAMQRVEGFKVGSTTGLKAAPVPTASSASMPSIKPAAVPMSVPDRPSVVAAPSVPERLGGGDRPSVAVITREEVGQDVRSRPVAHIVTGGLGG